MTVGASAVPAPPFSLHPDRFFDPDPAIRRAARELYEGMRQLPLVCPHGHVDPSLLSEDRAFPEPSALLITPDHYLFRMLFSQGVSLESLGVPARDAKTAIERDPRKVWRLFASNYHLFRGTPSRAWLDYELHELFGVRERLCAESADRIYDQINERLKSAEFRPRALFDSFNIEVLATTESPIDPLDAHRAIASSGWSGRVITAYRPDPVIDPEHEAFAASLERFSELTNEDVLSWRGYLEAHRKRRAVFAKAGATSTDHGHPTAATADLTSREAERLFARVTSGNFSPADAELFRAAMLVEMARMSLEDGLVMQLHPGAFRNHNRWLFTHYGRDKGADVPLPTEYVHALRPLLDRFGNERALTLILFTLDETSYSRELAPLAGHYPILKLGPAWWFHDSPEGMRRFREQTTETAGFYNTVGFNDDTRAFLSIPARHDLARRVDCSFLARLVVEHRLEEDEAAEIAVDLAYRLPKEAYKL